LASARRLLFPPASILSVCCHFSCCGRTRPSTGIYICSRHLLISVSAPSRIDNCCRAASDDGKTQQEMMPTCNSPTKIAVDPPNEVLGDGGREVSAPYIPSFCATEDSVPMDRAWTRETKSRSHQLLRCTGAQTEPPASLRLLAERDW
jgi:hypothetical protein